MGAVNFWQEPLAEEATFLASHIPFSPWPERGALGEGPAAWKRMGDGRSVAPLTVGPALEDGDAWQSLVRRIEVRLQAGGLEKIVASRFRQHLLTVTQAGELSRTLSDRVLGGPPQSVHRFHLLGPCGSFFGFSPELLFRIKGDLLEVPAIAGTLAREGSGQEAGDALLRSEKNRREHQYVVDGIRSALEGLGLSVEVGPTAPLILPRLVHLRASLRARVPLGFDLMELRKILHPTPAIGGFPPREAAQWLARNEGWSRGLFASPIILRLPDETLGIVAIRSALFSGTQLYLFAGAGYVKGSSAESEWRETRIKMDSICEQMGVVIER